MLLKRYRKKRNFKDTSEPRGKIKSAKSKNLYVIQKHAASHLHYDFRLELDGVLKSWAIPKGPSLDPNVKRLAVHVEDHPLEYGNFEGNIPKGQYGGGAVMLWDKGEWLIEKEDPNKAYEKGSLTFSLKGKKLKGLWKLVRIKSSPDNWLLIKIEDKYARSSTNYDIIQKKSKSVVSGKSIEQLAKANISQQKKSKEPGKAKVKTKIKPKGKRQRIPSLIKPQLATLVEQPPQGDEWLHEIKFDGYRLIAFIENKNVRLMTRNNQNWTSKFPSIVKELTKLALPNAIFDGEIVILDKDQRSDFQLLQNAIKDNKNKKFIYYIFDLIYYDGYDLSSEPLIERKKILHTIITSDTAVLRYSDHVFGSGAAVFAESCKLSLEGIISKNINSLYVQKRTRNWLKVKCLKRQEFVIGGYTLPKASRKNFGSLLLGVYSKNKKFIYCGHVGTGFNDKSLTSIFKQLKKHETTHMPFEKMPPGSKNVKWIKPVLIAEVEFAEWTSDSILRHPSFKGMRSDKSPKSIGVEKAYRTAKASNIKSAELTHPDKILFPKIGITKQQLFDYYKNIQKWILPYIINRPITLVRCPSGQLKDCFYQKHTNSSTPEDLKSLPIKTKHKTENYIYIDNVDGLLSLPQLGVLEIHTWGSRIDDLENPDMIVFDLDPAVGVAWKEVVAAAFEVRAQLKKIKLKSLVKTTGGKGLHVVVPITPEYGWDDIKAFAHALVNYLVEKNPDKYIATMSKSKRRGKIFIDYLRNLRGATAVAPYSTRANDFASIATPLSWSELTNNIKDTTYTIKTIFKRLDKMKQDPWKDFFKIKQSLRLDKFI